MPSKTSLLVTAGVSLAAGIACLALAYRGPAGPGKDLEAAAAPGQEAAASLQALADTVRARALRQDTLGLVRLLIDDTLFRRHVYPASPAYDSSRESVFQFIRGMDKANSAKGLRRMLFDVEALGPERVPTEIAVDTVRAKGGTLYMLKRVRGVRLFGGALAVDGAYRVLNYSESGADNSAMDRAEAD